MWSRFIQSLTLAIGVVAAGTAAADVTMPSEFEQPTQNLQRMFSYFGGVATWGTEHSTTTIHSGNSLRINIVFRPDPNTNVAGCGLGTFGISAPNLAVPAGANTFSITIDGPVSDSLVFTVTVREDDNHNNQISAASGDDQWETERVTILPGINVYNLPASAFTLANPGTGNGVRNFNNSTRMGFFLTFETNDTLPGGVVEHPVSFLIDHVGFYVGPQSIPAPPSGACCLSDGACQALTQAACVAVSGSYQGDAAACGNVSCPQPVGACCIGRSSCSQLTATACAAQGGAFNGVGALCTPELCLPNPACPPDYNGADGLDSQDFFDFLDWFFTGNADFNGQDGTDSQDYFDFTSAFFAGC